MRPRLVILGAALALILAAASAITLQARAARQAAPYELTALRVRLFYSDRGAFSEDLLDKPDLALWNTPIGEGDAGAPSSSLLVVAEVSGAAGSYEAGRGVELTAATGRKTVLRRAVPLDLLGKEGRTYVGFWLYGTGCEHLRLAVRLVGQSASSQRMAEIPFKCGE
jgi:hypothetical protein